MLPVILNIGAQPISSFGLFLLLAFLTASYVIWRLVRVYEVDEEKTIDLILLTFFGGLVFARLYFYLFHISQFQSFSQVLLINRYPGLSFWGALIGGFLTLKFFCSRMKVSFYQAADIGMIGLFASLVISSFGCLLGSCQYGQLSDWPVAVTQVGVVGKRFPLQVFEGLIFLLFYLYFWRQSLKFHINGKILSLGLIFLGLEKLLFEPFRGDQQIVLGFFSIGYVWSLLLAVLGLRLYYGQTKRSFKTDLNFLLSVLYRSNTRKYLFTKIRRSWYNLVVDLRFLLKNLKRRLTRRLNIKPNPTKFD